MLRAIFYNGQHIRQVLSARDLMISKRLLHLSSCCMNKTTLEVVREKVRTVAPESRKPKVKMPPYVKNLFKGKIDPHIFGYGELDQGALDVVQEMSQELEKFMNAQKFILFDQNQPQITSEVISKLKETGIFKVNIPKEYGGLELSCTEILFLCEVLSRDPSLFQTLNVHIHYISSLLTNFASSEQKAKYLPSVASGDLQIGFALWEENAGVDVSCLDCSADFLGDQYVLNGSKRWVCNGGIADKFIVFASEVKGPSKGSADTITCFLVDKHADGITAKKMDTLGMNEYNAWEISFENTTVPKENVIGDAGHGINMIRSLLHGKFTLAGAHVGLLRDLLNKTVHHAINRTSFGKPLIKNDIVKQHLAEAATRLYALESVTYMTADLYDNIEDPDIEVETAIVKLYSAETVPFIVKKCLTILGSDSYIKDKPYEKILRDTLFHPLVENSVDTLRMTIAMLCLQHAGNFMQESVYQKRNPLFYPAKAIKDYFTMVPEEEGFTDIVYEHVHPSLENGAKDLERAILKCRRVTEVAFARWGKQIEEKQMNLARLADLAVDMYITTAALSRSSRALSIGTRFSDVDGSISSTLVWDTYKRMCQTLQEIEESPYGNNDANYWVIADTVLHERKYYSEHPLARTY
ncbi:complex I assembly factor ACAD9, mitochondrial [Frankliniella occidentalis]|uniref:Complex I assembly factor ACAD9, mitochondrial n=1 Tax=Frankliniella occidentalis TaxID=133901 RepID=A0A6J1S8T7_FRAOC|nr:complex I assembly factor ACAD9, mitochondrial [Frankliniella occidentalis]